MFVLIFDRHDLWPSISTFPSLLIDKEKDSRLSPIKTIKITGNPQLTSKQKIIDKQVNSLEVMRLNLAVFV